MSAQERDHLMSVVRQASMALAASLALVGLAVAPAQANNPVLSQGSASAKYVDVTDNLCARTTDSGYYAEALIKSGSTIVFRVSDVSAGGSWSCTGNLSIPEDKKYTLQVVRCSKALDACTGRTTTFFS